MRATDLVAVIQNGERCELGRDPMGTITIEGDLISYDGCNVGYIDPTLPVAVEWEDDEVVQEYPNLQAVFDDALFERDIRKG